MPAFVVRPATKLELGDAVEFILRHGRASFDQWVCGPFSLEAMDVGFTVAGDTEDLRRDLVKRYPSLTVEVLEE